MRRVLANLLLVLWTAGFGVPLLPAQTTIPACCRRAGAHHCAMQGEQPGFHARSLCCCFQHFTALTSSGAAFCASSHAVIFASHWQIVLTANSQEIAQFLADNTFKRGPPLA
jgi:hypothetical protein